MENCDYLYCLTPLRKKKPVGKVEYTVGKLYVKGAFGEQVTVVTKYLEFVEAIHIAARD
jgi:hypothetical protein